MVDEHPANAQASLAAIAFFLRRYPWRSVVVVLCLLLSGIADGFSVALILPLLQQVMSTADAGSSRLAEVLARVGLEPSLGLVLGLLCVGFLLKGALYWLAMNHVGFTVARVAKDLRLDLLRALLRARWIFFVTQSAGRFSNALTGEALKASTVYQGAAYLIAYAIQLGVYLLLALYLSWPTALAGLVTGALFVLVVQQLVVISRRTGWDQAMLLKTVSARIVDLFNGVKPMKAMAREEAMVRFLEEDTETMNQVQRRKITSLVTVEAVQEPIVVCIMALGLYVVLTYRLLAFETMLVQAYVFSRIFNQVNQLVRTYQRFVVDESSFWSIRSRTDKINQAQETAGGKPVPLPLRTGIDLVHMDFAYGEKPLFRDVTMRIPAHAWTAIIGTSGSGKTTLSDLVAGLYSPQRGAILLDGVPLAELDVHQWRRHIGYVPQELLLLHDSIFVNVTLGEADISREEAEQALRQAGAWTFVEQLPEGMDTLVGERGARLSGGQRQRIALARALVRKPELLILDEASASLDPESEASLCRTLRELCRTTTILAISHQPAFAREADVVYRVAEGQIKRCASLAEVEP
jgi:ATP-binding cassette, subfamily C, bacterial